VKAKEPEKEKAINILIIFFCSFSKRLFRSLFFIFYKDYLDSFLLKAFY